MQAQVDAIATNEAFFDGLLRAVMPDADRNVPAKYYDGGATIQGLLTQLRREWSNEGAAEREHCFASVLDALVRHMPPPVDSASAPPKVLVPGAGLSRLNWELKLRKYAPCGIERACSMLLASDYIFEHLLRSERSVAICPHAQEHSIGPTNVKRGSADLGRRVLVPDRDAIQAAAGMPAKAFTSSTIPGDFSAFSAQPEQRGAWDAVLSCFYVDASGDVIEAAEATRRVLKPNGLWVCCGPLEYDGTGGGHQDDGALRLCADELMLFVERRGFQILEQRYQRCDYTSDPESMLQIGFHALFFVARRVADAVSGGERSS